MDLLKKQRGGYRGQVTNLDKQIRQLWQSRNETQLDPLDLESVKLKIDVLQAKLTDLDKCIGESITQESELDEEASKTVQYMETLWDSQSKITLLIRKFSPISETPIANGNSESSDTQSAALKLPKLDILKFDGDPLNWQEFWDSYRHAIHDNKDLTDTEKFQHLKTLLTGDAMIVADRYQLTAGNYNSVIEVLIERFGSEELALFAHFDKLLALPMSNNDTHRLQTTYDETEKHIRSLVSLGLGEETFGQVFTPIILSKLPRNIRTDLHRRNGSKKWTLSALRELFRDEIKARQMGDWTLEQPTDVRAGKPSQSTKPNQYGSKTKNFPTAGALGSGAAKGPSKPYMDRVCIFCKGNHRHAECNEVRSIQERKELVKGLCYRCLKKGHMSNNCPKSPRCFYCGQTSHHSSLCMQQFGMSSSKDSRKPRSDSRAFVKSGASVLYPNSCLDPAAPSFDAATTTNTKQFSGVANSTNKPLFVQMQMAVVKIGSDKVPARLFFDSGCSRSYITAALAKQLCLQPLGKELVSNGRFEEKQRRTHSYSRVELPIPSTKEAVHLSLLVTDTIACPITRVPIDAKRYPILERVHLADPPPLRPENVSIDILIGNDQYYTIVEHERIELPGGLMLLGSKLGYITSGPISDVNFNNLVEPSHLSALFAHSSSVSFQNVDLEQFWSLEDIGVKDDSYIKADELALFRFNKTICFDGERYEVGWPWKSDHPELPTNFDLANSRLKALLKKLRKDSNLLEAYDRTIRDQLKAGVVERVLDGEPARDLIHYLPHHCVVKPDHATTKLRVVYDGSAKSARSLPSLNDSLLRGPVFLQDLCGMLLRFRSYQFAVTADIEKAFLQVSLKEADRDVTRFLWLKDSNGPAVPSNIATYRFRRVLFGVISSPFLLHATIKFFIRQSTLPLAPTIADGIYVDNLISGAATEQDCRQIYTSAKAIFAQNGMNIREWTSSSTSVQDNIPAQDQARACPVKVLGLIWDSKMDVLSCSARPVVAENVTTKRHLVSAASKVFDPLGFASPVLLQAKLLVQEIWVRKVKWDESLPSDIQERWLLISSSLYSIPRLKIQRFLGYPEQGHCLVHCFCDASCKAYAAVVYLQPSKTSKPRLVFSKSKLASIKPISMPRLELMGVLIGCRITNFVIKQMRLKSVTVNVWSDSKCVLQWLRSSKVLSVFVENRVKEIQSYDFGFRYIPTPQNPADISSRGCTYEVLVGLSL